jgi:hypothetical protein
MLSTSVFIFNPTFIAGNTYTIELYYSPASSAKFTRHGDVITDTAMNTYEIANSTSLPVGDGDVVTVTALSNNVLPVEDDDYNSTIATPGQVDLRPAVRTAGTLNSAVLLSGPNFSYTVTASWDSSSSANASEIGDSVVDSTGKEYKILSFSNPTTKWATTVVIQEVEKVGITPAAGQASLYRSTSNFALFQGSPISDAARTVIRNRDNFLIDAAIQEAGGGGGASNALEKEMDNNSGSTITKLTPVRVNSDGEMDEIDPSVEAEALSTIGVVKANTADSASGVVVLSGILEDVSTAIAVGSPVFLSKTGGITDVEPDIGSGGFEEGDFVIKIGTIMENSSNPSLKDLHVNIQLVGQL